MTSLMSEVTAGIIRRKGVIVIFNFLLQLSSMRFAL
jgi:hypothetical protein